MREPRLVSGRLRLRVYTFLSGVSGAADCIALTAAAQKTVGVMH
jgi:hypothetical protein